MNNQLKPLVVKLLHSLKLERTEEDKQKFDSAMAEMDARMQQRTDEIMKDFRSKLNVK